MRHAACLLCAALALACVGGEQTPAPIELPVELDGACPADARVGLFSIVHEVDYSAIDGEMFDAVDPATLQREMLAMGGCRLWLRDNPFCDPPCSSGQTCAGEGMCVPYPARVESGTVSIAGLATVVHMQPRSDARYFETELPHPVFEPGAAISLTSSGGEVEALALSGVGLEPLSLAPEPWLLTPGQPLTIAWTAADQTDATVLLRINVDQHGLSPATLECEGPDSGSFEVPAAVVDALLDAGVSGYPTGHAYRRTLDSMQTSVGCVELEVRSHRSAELGVAGHTPCTSNADCPAPLTCELDTQTCA